MYFFKPAQMQNIGYLKKKLHPLLPCLMRFFLFFTKGTYLLNSERIMDKGNLSTVFLLFSEVKSKVTKEENIPPLESGSEKKHANCDAAKPASKSACPLGFL